jgi:hypothetical protein
MSLERFKRVLAGPAMGGGVVGCRLNRGRWAGPEGSQTMTAIVELVSGMWRLPYGVTFDPSHVKCTYAGGLYPEE